MSSQNCFGTTHATNEGKDQDNFDEQNRETVMPIKLLINDDQLPHVPFDKNSCTNLESSKGLHETSNKSFVFLLKNMLFFIMMNDQVSLQDHFNKIKDI